MASWGTLLKTWKSHGAGYQKHRDLLRHTLKNIEAAWAILPGTLRPFWAHFPRHGNLMGHVTSGFRGHTIKEMKTARRALPGTS